MLDGVIQADKCLYMVGPGSVHPLFLLKALVDDPYSLEYNVVRLNGSIVNLVSSEKSRELCVEISDGLQDATALWGPYFSLYRPKRVGGIVRIGRCVSVATEACSVIIVVVLMLIDFVLDLVVCSSKVGLEVEGRKTFWVEAMIGVLRGGCVDSLHTLESRS